MLLSMQVTAMRNRRGFSLIELLIVLSTISVLMALLLAGIQKARDAANRLRCQNNLKQIGLALHAYHDRLGALPPGYSSAVGAANQDLGPGWGWGAFLLDDLEQANLRRQLDFARDITDLAHSAARQTYVAVFVCPSSVAGTALDLAELSLVIAPGGYAGMFGSNELEEDPGGGNGVFFRNSRVRLADISDGASNTLTVGERSHRGARTTWVGAVTGADSAAGLVLGDTRTAPNSPFADEDDFGSPHTQGAHFLLADGSVRGILNSISPAVWSALATRAGGEVHSDAN